MFSGSYDAGDVTFLLKRARVEPTDVVEKERLIQTGRRHYSEMIGREAAPSAAYLRVFRDAHERGKVRFARDLLALARHVARVRPGGAVLVSLARAGTPVGVLLRRALTRLLGHDAAHYSVSIIRDRGLDEVALRHVLDRHPASAVVFVDGWTGKGVIARELRSAVTRFNARHGTDLDPGLYAVADLCGEAVFAPTAEDYLIPSSVLGATISGLVSRSILNDAVVGPGDFHACVYCEELAPHDLSRWFVDEVFAAMEMQAASPVPAPPRLPAGRLRVTSENFLADVRRRFGTRDVNHVKPGIGEATRVMLRRVPGRLLLRDAASPDVAHLALLACEKNVPITLDPTLPYAAAALIKEMGPC